ncbi:MULTISPECIES: M20 family metallopeptidase [unclassified Paenibacillus]|uniref:M20 family metallopeptidase n=1 Tax=unclassified Paenibacillus TaxID=185978 RepID=UPI001AE121D5|nr:MULTISPECIES: M20 family metallopeptidase [unclassified Paenibacillus]MBP1157013.1 glutamate carboxypeptidase [Paenibacillus sp. PvP091]MBP1172248.1 glutamate carboxypeptidase [Paenibacillus sp. PvR098]MBP2438629.1 glutamate carboxypeptidase [Paenibacillus sp. PvP052]
MSSDLGLPMVQDEMLRLLKTLVELESPSDNPSAVHKLLLFLKDVCCQWGGHAELLGDQDHRAQLKVTWGTGERKILILAHVDTVWPLGEVVKRPFRIEDGKAYGPGILDMKAGIVQALFAVKGYVDRLQGESRQIVFLFTTDEEIGSPASRAWIEQEAQNSAAVLVVEPAGPAGKLKVARKGWGLYELNVLGKAAHAGMDPENGANAVVELARQVLRIQSLTEISTGINVNIGVIEGGSRPNMVPADARAMIDIRVSDRKDIEVVESFMNQLSSYTPGTTVRMTGGMNRPPLEQNEKNRALFSLAKEAGTAAGIEIKGVHVGGVSDGNFTSFLGVPTLDGLGAVGAGPHALHEHIIIDEMVPRSKLLVELFERIFQSR